MGRGGGGGGGVIFTLLVAKCIMFMSLPLRCKIDLFSTTDSHPLLLSLFNRFANQGHSKYHKGTQPCARSQWTQHTLCIELRTTTTGRRSSDSGQSDGRY